MKKSAKAAAMKAFDIEMAEIARAKEVMDWEAFDKAVALLKKAQRIGTAGCGHSGICCTHFAHSLCCIERPARFISPAEAVHGAMGFIQKNDVMVLASRGGKTAELIPLIDIAHKKGAFVISVTEKMDSPLAKGADVVLPMNVQFETDKYNSQSTSSFVALSAVFDALQTALIEETGYINEQFALIHPAGAVGERLNKK